jgi:hypothetical protein
VLALCVACGSIGPIGPLSGGRLSGQEGDWPTDWNSVSDVVQIQLETALEDPESVNLWLVVVDGDAYVASSLLSGTKDPEVRAWVRNIGIDPRVRVRIDGVVYAARLESVADDSVRARVFEAFRVKYPHLEESRGEDARYFRIASRS